MAEKATHSIDWAHDGVIGFRCSSDNRLTSGQTINAEDETAQVQCAICGQTLIATWNVSLTEAPEEK